jgi:hypothetical protein
MLYIPVVDQRSRPIKASEDRFIPGQAYSGEMNTDDPIETGL